MGQLSLCSRQSLQKRGIPSVDVYILYLLRTPKKPMFFNGCKMTTFVENGLSLQASVP